MVDRLNSDTQRLRVIEQSSESLVSRAETIEQSALQQRKELQKALSELSSRIASLDSRVDRIEGTLKEVIGHMKKLATEAKVKELEDLIEIYNPVKSNFLTREEAERLLRKG
jgi:flagellar motility protein MotE (MotC chaperone)